ncbi:MAG: undecaprenyl-diphosphatase UppP [Candidatus Moranbacteria bacterium]|nr:undecaprenyl-diphosphatase UppP [Candidatus Moranbacteria bacterium]
MAIFHAILLGLVQGAGEFLPISSSAHLVLMPWFFHFPDPGLSFDVALHLGTLVAVILYFWRDWLEILRLAFLPKVQSSELLRLNLQGQYNKKILYFLIIATIPGAVFGYFLESYAETVFRSPLLIAFTLTALGLILYLVDRYHVHRKTIENMTWRDSLWIGLSQAGAIIPGVSRSGATITAGLFLGLNRESAARFSFLLSTPIILGAALVKLPHLFAAGFDAPLIVGMITAAASGYISIKYLLCWIQRASYAVFFWYRIALAAVIIAVYFAR